jgi:WD40 repeat protein
MAFSRDGKYVLSGDERRALRYWNLATCTDVHVFEGDFTGHVNACYVNPKGTQALGTGGKFLILFDLVDGKPIQKMALTDWHFNPSAISPDGKIVATVRIKP